MNNKIKGFVLGVLSTFILINSIAYASGNTELIETVLNSVNVELNKQKVASAGENYVLSNGEEVPFSFVYKGTTYLPIRKVAEILNKEVIWIGETQTISLNDRLHEEIMDCVEGQTEVSNETTKDEVYDVTMGKLVKYIIQSLEIPLMDTDLVISDVPKDDELYPFIATAINENLFSLYSDKTFKPNRWLTRAQYATIIVKALGVNETVAEAIRKSLTETIEIKDIENHWASNNICIAVNYGLMSKYDDDTFRPNEVFKDPLIVDNGLKLLKKKIEKVVEKAIAEMESSIEKLALNKAYKLESGLELIIQNIKVNEELGYYELMIDYKLENNTEDKELEEGYFTVTYDNEKTDTQYGFFGKLFPYEVKKRSIKFKYMKEQKPLFIEFKLFSARDSIKLKIE